MAQFEYTAQSKSGMAISGVVAAKDGGTAMEELGAMGLQNIELRTVAQPTSHRPLGADDFIFFNEQLASMTGAGLCLDAGLRQLGRDIRSRRLRGVLESVAGDLERGGSLPEALERHAAQLPAFYGRVVQAGVQSGRLSATLLNLSQHVRLVTQTRRMLAEALAYPGIVLVLALGVMLAVLWMIVPSFVSVFEDFGTPIPSVTAFLFALADALPFLLTVIGAAALGVAAIVGLLRFSATGRLLQERLVLGLPMLGLVIRYSLRARFLRAVAFIVESGIPLPEGLRLSADATGSGILSEEVNHIAREIERGTGIAEACRTAKLVPPMFGYAATEGGAENLRYTLRQLAESYESRAIQGQAMLRGWVAPIAIILVGAFIALIIAGLFMPLISLVQTVGM